MKAGKIILDSKNKGIKIMKFEELNENELFRIKGGEDNSLFYQIGW